MKLAVPAETKNRTAAALAEDFALAELKDPELSLEAIEQLSRDAAAIESRKVRFAVAAHRRTARPIALRIVGEPYPFELMPFALSPAVAADLKRVADELLLSRLISIRLGERIALARRSSSVLAGALLLDQEARVWQPALENTGLSEAAAVQALGRKTASPSFVEVVSHHVKWSVRNEIQVALLGNAHTPLARAIEFSRRIPGRRLRDILHTSRLPGKMSYLRNHRPTGTDERPTADITKTLGPDGCLRNLKTPAKAVDREGRDKEPRRRQRKSALRYPQRPPPISRIEPVT